ncbi:hypothetical protein ACWFQ8_17100 [Streptomyces sp. NPDC055254]
MNGARHLLSEDRPEYERLLDEVLHATPDRADAGPRPSPEQLRTMALNASALITAAAAAEYDHYVKIRRQLGESAPPATPGHRVRAPAGLGQRLGTALLGTGRPGGRRAGDGVAPQLWGGMSYGRRLLAALLGLHVRPAAPAGARPRPRHSPERPSDRGSRAEEPPRETGAGLATVVGVSATLLSMTAAVLSFALGLILQMSTGDPAIARTVFGAGRLFGAMAVGGFAVLVTLLLVTALRNGGRRAAEASEAAQHRELEDEVARAREGWRHALLERGIRPFVRDALAGPDTFPPGGNTPSRPTRIRNRGYTGPDFSTPGETSGPTSSTSPGLTSPDYGGREHLPD